MIQSALVHQTVALGESELRAALFQNHKLQLPPFVELTRNGHDVGMTAVVPAQGNCDIAGVAGPALPSVAETAA